MFEQTFVNTHATARKPWTVAASLMLQTGFVATILILPLLHPGIITPRFDLQAPLFLTKLTPPPVIPETVNPEKLAPRKVGVFVNPLMPPRSVPKTIDMRPDAAPEIVTAQFNGTASALADFSVARPVAPPAPPAPPAIKAQVESHSEPVRVGGEVQSARLISAPKPSYPSLAKAARVQGAVRMEAVIGRDGAIRDLVVLGGPALLVSAAVQAVTEWRYRPTLLNGEPVEVITEIVVSFRLNDR